MQRQTLPSSLAAMIATNHTSPDENLFSRRESVQYEQHESPIIEADRSDSRYDDQIEKLERMSEDDHKGTVESASESSDLANFETQLDIDKIDTNRMSDPQLQQSVDQTFIPERNAAIQGPAVPKHKLSCEQEEVKQNLKDAIREREEFKRKVENLVHEIEDAKRERNDAKHKLDEVKRGIANAKRERDEVRHELEDAKSKRDEVKQEPFNPTFVAALELVNSAQPTVLYTMERNGGTRSATAMEAAGVEMWPNFLKKQTEYSGPRQVHFKEEKRFIPRHNTPIIHTTSREGVVWVHPEQSLQCLAEHVIYPTLNDLMTECDTWLVTSSTSMSPVRFAGGPDGVTVLWHKDSTTGGWARGEPVCSWKNEPDMVLQGVENVVERYKNDAETKGLWFRTVTQIVGNMIGMRAKTAVLNTGIHAIFFLLKRDGKLWISPTIPSNRAGVGSVWNTIDYVLHLREARDEKLPSLQPVEIKLKEKMDASKPAGDESGGPRAAAAKGKENRSDRTQSGSQPCGGTGRGQSRGLSERRVPENGSQDRPLGSVAAKGTNAPCKRAAVKSSLRYLGLLQEHADRSTWKAQRWSAARRAWEDVVVKWFRPEGAARYESEVACYRRASSLQGVSVAELLDHGMAIHLEGESLPRVGLMVRWAGNAYDALPPPALERARRTLEELHGLGVVHGDVKTLNMGYDPKTGRVVLFDFSEGMTRDMFEDEGGFQGACEEDLQGVDWDLAWAAANPELCRYYV